MKSVEDKIIEVLNELEKWENRREKVEVRYDLKKCSEKGSGRHWV